MWLILRCACELKSRGHGGTSEGPQPHRSPFRDTDCPKDGEIFNTALRFQTFQDDRVPVMVSQSLPRSPRLQRLLPILVLTGMLSACATISFERETETSGTFNSEAWAFTIFAWDFPKESIQTARDNVFDAGLSNLEVTSVRTTPYLGWWDWLLDIVGLRKTVLTGTWGFSGEQLRKEKESSTPLLGS